MTTDAVWMTPAALARLQAELDELTKGGQGEGEPARAARLRELIRRAETSAKPDDGLVEPGMRITVRFDDDGSELEFLFGDRELASLDTSIDLDVYSPTSPLGRAINGRHVGDTVSYEAPHGAEQVTVTAARPFD